MLDELYETNIQELLIFLSICTLSFGLKFLRTCFSNLVPSFTLSLCVTSRKSSLSIWAFVHLKLLQKTKKWWLNSLGNLALIKWYAALLLEQQVYFDQLLALFHWFIFRVCSGLKWLSSISSSLPTKHTILWGFDPIRSWSCRPS